MRRHTVSMLPVTPRRLAEDETNWIRCAVPIDLPKRFDTRVCSLLNFQDAYRIREWTASVHTQKNVWFKFNSLWNDRVWAVYIQFTFPRGLWIDRSRNTQLEVYSSSQFFLWTHSSSTWPTQFLENGLKFENDFLWVHWRWPTLFTVPK